MRKTAIFLILLLPALLASHTHAQDVGDRLPPLHVTDWILGEPEDVGSWGDGKIYILEFWGTWCSPCLEVIPHLTALQQTYRNQGLVVIGYSWEDPEILRPFVEQMGETMQYVVVSDTEEKTVGVLSEAGAIQGFPYSFLIDASGTIVWHGNSKLLPDVVAAFFK